MRNEFSELATSVTAVQWGPATGRVAMSMDDPASMDIRQTAMMDLNDRWMRGIDMTMFHTVFVGSAPDRDAVFVGDDGGVAVLHKHDSFDEGYVTTSARSPRNTGHLRSGAQVGEDIVVVGMQRQVYRFEGHPLVRRASLDPHRLNTHDQSHWAWPGPARTVGGATPRETR